MMNASFRTGAELFPELNRLQSVLDQMFRPAERSSIRSLNGAGFPVLNVGATADAVEVMALAPGIDAASLQITIDRGLLTIAGERKGGLPEGQEVSVYARERFEGPFRRVVSLPDDVDPAKVEARYQDGILRISVAKRESSKPRRVTIS